VLMSTAAHAFRAKVMSNAPKNFEIFMSTSNV
jgi:hypothetical protein